ncbi:hypothetical protein FFONT_0572 [Fervidicoccus fontis Kam940]|uniref:Uncharacterized protein n=1 Tax=Fervidicoccus fontis (strain DSM 19380 / JCM 18336 / VKM B-2539 / Kam940) TaxID=1163730 RepID=I0A0Q5_FERFK|nr:hypothetical protein FFONT_0572 [Fervidicoccus fontis Kam940]
MTIYTLPPFLYFLFLIGYFYTFLHKFIEFIYFYKNIKDI